MSFVLKCICIFVVFNFSFLTSCAKSSKNESKENLPIASPSVEPLLNPESSQPSSVSSQTSSHPLSSRALKLEVVYSQGEDVENLTQLQTEKTSTDETIIFHTKLYFDEQNYILSWPEEFYGDKIVSASYSFRVQTAPGVWKGTRELKLAWPDREKNRFLLPFSTLFEGIEGYGKEELDFDHEQVLNLELLLESRKLIPILVKFQASGPLPELERKRALNPLQANRRQGVSFREMASDIARNGWEVAKEVVENPTQKSFKLWIRSKSIGLKLKHLLKFPDFLQYSHPKWNIEQSQGELVLNRLDVVHGDGQLENKELIENAWVSVVLRPAETIQLSWYIVPNARAANCAVPVRVPYVGMPAVPRLGIPRVPLQAPAPRWIEWSMSGLEFEGRIEKEIRVAEQSTSVENATSEYHEVVGNLNTPLDFQFVKRKDGENVTTDPVASEKSLFRKIMKNQVFPAHTCQGFFP